MRRWREAIASVSLSHARDCHCEVCKAAEGDEEAMIHVISEVAEREAEMRSARKASRQRLRDAAQQETRGARHD